MSVLRAATLPSAACCLPRLGRPAALRSSRPAARSSSRIHAVEKSLDELEEEGCANNIGDFCTLDPKTGKPMRLTLGEKEQLFLEALSSFYFEGQPAALSDQEFDLLKEELLWSGSKVAVLSKDEKKFLEAQMAFNAGKPIMSNAEFDDIKLRLKQSGSSITAQGPRCSLRSQRMYSDASPDYLKLLALNVPAAALVLVALFGLDDLTGFEITRVIELPEPYGIVALWGLLLPAIYVFASAITNFVFRDALILKAPCPNCGTENSTYFGDILTVSGNRDKNDTVCSSCKSKLSWDARQRQVVVDELPPSSTLP